MQSKYSQMWEQCLGIIRDIIPAEQFSSWFSPLSFVSYVDNELTIACPSEFFSEQLDERYMRVMGMALKRVFNERVQLIYQYPVVADDPTSSVKVGSTHPSPVVKPAHNASSNPFKEKCSDEIDSQLKPDLTF
ncbi:MAG: hypothetical protein K2L26_02585, partial [Duncaniella sp.]|nr:hypothetical protein [Duncaniella sp.]